jgi:hypothetical protein
MPRGRGHGGERQGMAGTPAPRAIPPWNASGTFVLVFGTVKHAYAAGGASLSDAMGMVAQHLAGQVRSCPGRTRAPSYSPRYGGIVGVSPWYLLPLCVAGAPQLLCREPDKLRQKGRP